MLPGNRRKVGGGWWVGLFKHIVFSFGFDQAEQLQRRNYIFRNYPRTQLNSLNFKTMNRKFKFL
jgi:hypothetical protein